MKGNRYLSLRKYKEGIKPTCQCPGDVVDYRMKQSFKMFFDTGSGHCNLAKDISV